METTNLNQVVLTAEEADLLGLRSAAEGGMLFCGVSEEQFAIGGVTYKWPKGLTLLWSLGFSRLGVLNEQDLKQVYADCFAEIMAACDVTAEYTANPRTANILVNVQRLDGRGGTLADMQIPVGNVGQTTQLAGRIDDGESWGLFENPPAGKIDFYRVALHELLHAMGLGHAPVDRRNPALIEPMYNPHVRNLTPRDKAELVRRYGPAKDPQPKPEPPPSSPGDGIAARVEVTIGGRKYAASGPLKPV